MLLLKDVLAARLRSLMDQRPDLDTQIKIHKKTELSQSTVQRILSRQVHTSLDIVEALARAFDIEPLDLLKPIATDAPDQSIAPSYAETQLLTAWRKLSEEDKHRAMAFIAVSAQTRSARHDREARQINVDSKQPVPAPLSAAVKKASARKPGVRPEITAENHGEKAKRKTVTARN
jgi:transcriptional regulator with XRE-family HTH domain